MFDSRSIMNVVGYCESCYSTVVQFENGTADGNISIAFLLIFLKSYILSTKYLYIQLKNYRRDI